MVHDCVLSQECELGSAHTLTASYGARMLLDEMSCGDM